MTKLDLSKYSSLAETAPVFCTSVTPFHEDGSIDFEGLEQHLERLIGAGLGLYLGSPGTGEGHALSEEELLELYRFGVKVAAGRVPIYANQAEARTADQTLERSKIAVEAGVDVVQIYTVDAGHGMRPTYKEQEAYYRSILDNLDYPVGLSVNLLAGGYRNPGRLLAQMAADYPQVVSINVLQPPVTVLWEIMDAAGDSIDYYAGLGLLPEALMLGATGGMASEPNVIPNAVAALARSVANGNVDDAGKAMRVIFAVKQAVLPFLPSGPEPTWSARWVKASMSILGMPGSGEGRMRAPYLSPTADDIAQLAEWLEPLDVNAAELAALSWGRG